MPQTERASFGSKLGMILATAGGAVGLGNVWRFSYMTGDNGGAAFICIYIVSVLLLGLPCMICEFIIGSHAASNTARAYTKLSNGTAWKWVGYLGVLTGFLITGYYGVVSGWCLEYLYASATGAMKGGPEYFADYFKEFSANPWRPVLWLAVILGVAHYVIIHGVRNGIERASKILMPLLFVLLLIIVVAACMLPGATDGLLFLFRPDFSKLTSDVFLAALGQSFYLMIFPAAASVGVRPDSGPSLIFITLPNVFEQAFSSVPVVGYMVAVMFFMLLGLAALTSLISLHEVSTAFFQEEMHITRNRAAWIVTLSCGVIGAFCSLSLGKLDVLSIGDKSLFDLFDFVTGQIFLPIGGFLTCLFLGWYVPKKLVKDEYTNWGTQRGSLFGVFYFLIRFVCPTAILAVFLHQLGVL